MRKKKKKKIVNDDFLQNFGEFYWKKWIERKIERKKKKKKKGNKGNTFGEKLTGVSALETFVKLEGEGNVDLHHFHLRYTRRMCHNSSTPSEHQFVAVNAKHDHISAQKN